MKGFCYDGGAISPLEDPVFYEGAKAAKFATEVVPLKRSFFLGYDAFAEVTDAQNPGLWLLAGTVQARSCAKDRFLILSRFSHN